MGSVKPDFLYGRESNLDIRSGIYVSLIYSNIIDLFFNTIIMCVLFLSKREIYLYLIIQVNKL